jgi:hypothetical protein
MNMCIFGCSHVIKAQPQNMAMLDKILKQKMRLFDYECITQGGRDDTRRTVAFGRFGTLIVERFAPVILLTMILYTEQLAWLV